MKSKPFTERNRSQTAQRKLKKLASENSLDIDFVTALANFSWDFDPFSAHRKEAHAWVNNEDLPPESGEQLRLIANTVGLPTDFKLDQKQAVEELCNAHTMKTTEAMWQKLYAAGPAKHAAWLSEFGSYFWLQNINTQNASCLDWNEKQSGILGLARNLFCKIFRAGSMDRGDLQYLWCDLVLDLPYQNGVESSETTWLDQLLLQIQAKPDTCGLSELIKCCKGLAGGGKHFKQTVLESLAFAGVLSIHDKPIDGLFLPEHRNDNTPHFYANEWRFPLRWWVTSGGSINRNALH